MKDFFKFNKQKVIIALLYMFVLSVLGGIFFKYNLTGDINTTLIGFVYPVEVLLTIVFESFLDAEKIQASMMYKVLLVIFSSMFVLSLKVIYYYTVACFIFYIKNKVVKLIS